MSEDYGVLWKWRRRRRWRSSYQLSVFSFQKIRDRFAAIAIAKKGLRAMSQMSSKSSMWYTGFVTFYVVGVVVGMGLGDKYKLIMCEKCGKCEKCEDGFCANFAFS